MRKRYTQAINEALFEEMERDPNVILFGEDVELAIFGDTRGLYERFGPSRIRNTPICEATLTGMAVGATAAGYRVVLHMMFSNFLYTGFDAIANQMAKLRLMTGGQLELPITILAGYGGGRSNAAQHSDSPHPLLMNLGGVNVAMPATPADAKGLLKTAIRGRNPTFFMEASGRGGDSGEVPEGDHTVAFGEAVVRREGPRHHVDHLRHDVETHACRREAPGRAGDRRRSHRPPHPGSIRRGRRPAFGTQNRSRHHHR